MDKGERDLWRAVTSTAGLVGQLGFAVAAPIVCCALGGFYLDAWLDAHGIVVFTMVILGIAGAGYSAYRILASTLRDTF